MASDKSNASQATEGDGGDLIIITMKKAIFISGPKGSGKWAMAENLAQDIKGEAAIIRPGHSLCQTYLYLNDKNTKVIFIDWPADRSSDTQDFLALYLKDTILNGSDKDIFILSQLKPVGTLKGVIEDRTPK